MEEEMYSLPYKEALAQHRKKYGNNVPFISKDQYELKQAQIEKQKKMSASADKPNWWEQEGPSDEIIAKNGNVTAADIAERRLTPEQQGIQAKGNAGDNKLENPDKLDTADITKLDKELNKTVGQKDSYTPEERAKAAKNIGITKEVPGTNSETVTPKEGDTAAKGQYNKSMMSIWDAYRNRLIDKDTAGYFTIDALANAAKNMGRSIGNVGAQFTGGSIDNGHDESMWDQRKDKIFNAELQGESESIDTFENALKSYQLDKSKTINDMLRDFNAKANDKSLSESERKVYQVLAVQLAGAGLDGNAQIASVASGVWDDIKNAIRGNKK